MAALNTPLRLLAMDAVAGTEQRWDFGLDLCRPFYEDRLSALRTSVKFGGDPDVYGRKSMRVLATSDPNHVVQHAAFDALTVFRTVAASQYVHELLDDAATPADIRERAQKFVVRYNRFASD